MVPFADTDPVGRHGRIGIEVLPHDARPFPGSEQAAVASLVDEVDQRVAESVAKEKAERRSDVAKAAGHNAVAQIVATS